MSKRKYQQKRLTCNICMQIFPTKVALNDHSIEHQRTTYHPIDSNISNRTTFQCNVCQQLFDALGKLKTHMRTHCIGVRDRDRDRHPDRYPDLYSDGIQTDSEAVLRRTLNIDAATTASAPSPPLLPYQRSEVNYCCQYCKKSFKNKHRFTIHLYTHSNVERPHKCDMCTQTFSQASHLRVHRVRHTDTGFYCDFCGKLCHTKSNMLNHLFGHVKPFVCSRCNKKFASSFNCKKHEALSCGVGEVTAKSAEIKPVKISVKKVAKVKIEKDSVASGKLENEQLRCRRLPAKGPLSQRRRYQCYVCHKKFRTKIRVKIHMDKIHFQNPVRNYLCSICDKTFETSYTLRAHFNRVHVRRNQNIRNIWYYLNWGPSENESATCDICQIVFNNRRCLRDHIIRAHIIGKTISS